MRASIRFSPSAQHGSLESRKTGVRTKLLSGPKAWLRAWRCRLRGVGAVALCVPCSLLRAACARSSLLWHTVRASCSHGGASPPFDARPLAAEKVFHRVVHCVLEGPQSRTAVEEALGFKPVAKVGRGGLADAV